jgi:hypothetical protein
MPIRGPPGARVASNVISKVTVGGGGGLLLGGGGGVLASSSAASAAVAAASTSILATLLKLVFDVTGTTQGVYRDGGFLNLANFASIPSLQDVRSQIDFNAVFFCNALCRVVREKVPDAIFLNVDNNDIRNLHVLLRAMKDNDLVHVQGLSACGNKIANTDFTVALKPFKRLNELRLMGNPVTANDRYREAVRKALPDLVTLDGDGVQRPPLRLPWPQPPQITSDDGRRIVGCLADEFFAVAERRGADACVALYHEDAVFSLSVAPGAEMKAPEVSTNHPKRQDILKDFVSLRLAQNDRCRNITTARGPVRTVRGRADIGAALRNCLYPRGVVVLHNLNLAGITTDFMPSAAGLLAVVTMHGTMTWMHSLEPTVEAGVSRHYERTITVVPDAGSPIGFYICNDCVHLRGMDAMEPLWAGNAEKRVETLSRKYNVDMRVLAHVVPLAKSDLELHDMVTTGLEGMPWERFEDCLGAADSPQGRSGPMPPDSGGDNSLSLRAVQIARVAATFRCHPGRALDVLQRCAWNLPEARAAFTGPAAAGGGPAE